MTDFEQTLINYRMYLEQKLRQKPFFYHLTKSTWRKIQSFGIVSKYKEDKFTRHFCGMMDAKKNDSSKGEALLRYSK